ncbi:MAG TPA: FoF1 ATP synthase subunit gamma [Candidatus Binatia bacterium]|nr:FoF1 ATP synthase subunit gamma [Candidatus Binatia bacterium]
MASHRALRTKLRAYRSLGEVVETMRDLALIEIGKLGRAHIARRRVIDGIRSVADELLYHYPGLSARQALTPVNLLIGSERGFCGDYNDRILEHWQHHLSTAETHGPIVIAVGRKMGEKLPPGTNLFSTLEGAATSDELDQTLTAVVQTIDRLQRSRGTSALKIVAIYADENQGPRIDPILPMHVSLGSAPSARSAPDTNVPIADLFRAVVDQYVSSMLAEAFNTALIAENRMRLQHMSGAAQRLSQRIGELTRSMNRLRQEMITTEIETILLGASGSSSRRQRFRG